MGQCNNLKNLLRPEKANKYKKNLTLEKKTYIKYCLYMRFDRSIKEKQG